MAIEVRVTNPNAATLTVPSEVEDFADGLRAELVGVDAPWAPGHEQRREALRILVAGIASAMAADDRAVAEDSIDAEGGDPFQALSYQVVDKGTFPPTDAYLDKMIRWGEHWDFPADYLRGLHQIEVSGSS